MNRWAGLNLTSYVDGDPYVVVAYDVRPDCLKQSLRSRGRILTLSSTRIEYPPYVRSDIA